MKKLILAFILLVFLFAHVNSEAQNLKRRGFLGLKSSAVVTDSLRKLKNISVEKGILVVEVAPNSTLEVLKIQTGDVIFKLNNKPVTGMGDLRTFAKLFREGDDVMIDVERTGENMSVMGKVAPYPFESSDKYDVVYDEVKFIGGYLRVIVNKPKGEGKFKSIFFVPGYNCFSTDNLGMHPYGQLISGLVEKGYAVMRVEKPGMGDCFGTPDCESIDFDTELKAFQSGFDKFLTYEFVDKGNVFVFGHSLGGYVAPYIAMNDVVKGTIVYGTGVKTWYEYLIEMFRFQNILSGDDYVENEKFIFKAIPMLYDYLIMKKTPAELSKNAEYKSMLTTLMEYDGGEHVWGRHYKFWQDLQDKNMPEIWKSVKGDVLIIRGEADLESFSNVDNQLIADIVNFYHPGNAKFVLMPGIDHGFAKIDTPAESLEKRKVRGFYYENFNPAIVDKTDEWIKSVGN